MTTADARKRKQDISSSNWSEFVYSSPNSPQPQTNEINFEQMLNQPDLSRRHSVAVGELHFHSFENKQQNYNELEQLLGASFPSSWSSSNSSHSYDKRAVILDAHRSPISPTTPAFFSPTFLDALKHEEDSSFPIHDFILNHPNTTTTTTTTTITDDNTNWLLHTTPSLPKRKSSMSSTTTTSNQSPTNSSIHMISTPSPPSTMLYHHPSIPEEEDEDDMDSNHVKNNLILSRIMQGESNMSILKPLIQKYITHQYQDERKVMIFTSKVAQKSYGTEKRFLCPPPTTILSGASWFQPPFDSKPLAPNLVIHILGEKSSQNGLLEWKSNGATIDPTSLGGDTISGVTGNCVSKHLHINDADEKRKRVEVLVKITLGNGNFLGTLASKGIKVISKPSKKRQSLKNIELCIHHGTTVSLFNRIRSQTVSTKYLGVSEEESTGTCFVARTTSWDPFVIWIVDTTRSLDAPQPQLLHHPDNPHFPPPPAIALFPTSEPVALHYNQAVVLQCVTTGLVSPVMVIRKVDKGSMILGGNRVDDLSNLTGGECGDEAIGDPVSQLHKIAFQIVHDPAIAHSNKYNYQPTMSSLTTTTEWSLPETQQSSATYLACLDHVVGMHKTNNERKFVASRPIPSNPMMMDIMSSWNDPFDPYHPGGGKMINRKRRVSYDSKVMTNQQPHRRRVNSLNDIKQQEGRRGSFDRRSSVSSDTGDNGSCWTEDVSDASIWTIVGTDCASYKFYTPPPMMDFNSPFSSINTHPITPFPILSNRMSLRHEAHQKTLHLLGENFTRDISVWFGDVRSVKTEYKSRESLSCHIPDLNELISSPTCTIDKESEQRKIPLLFVRGDGIVYNTDLFFTF